MNKILTWLKNNALQSVLILAVLYWLFNTVTRDNVSDKRFEQFEARQREINDSVLDYLIKTYRLTEKASEMKIDNLEDQVNIVENEKSNLKKNHVPNAIFRPDTTIHPMYVWSTERYDHLWKSGDRRFHFR